MLKLNDKNFKLGILGGGQLGRMFIQEAINYNVSVSILDGDKNAPCAHLASEFFEGDLNDFQAVYDFGKKVNLLSIEIENVNVDALEKLESEGLAVFPQPAVLRMIKDKGLQKNFYRDHALPTADYFLAENKADILTYSAHFPFMQKLRKGGYDGKGVYKIKTEKDLENAFDAPCVLEKFIDFDKEIAVIGARNASGEVKLYPVVEMEFNPQANLVEFLFSPANISPEVEKEAQAIGTKIIEKTGIVGVLAVEFFVTKSGQVLVNEIAPRPHNSGHQTIEANYTSQYEQHLRAILDLPLGATGIIQASVMINILGEPGYEGDAHYQGLENVLREEGVFVHLYGKKTTKPFRKMGHVTILNPSLDKAKAKAQFVKNTLKVITV
jgi:5-(carboxyamino)imidazole ribonucleotide synthase